MKFLEDLLGKLELPASRAKCVYEQARSLLSDIEHLGGDANLNSRRVHSVPLVGKLRSLMLEHWNFLDEKQKLFVSF